LNEIRCRDLIRSIQQQGQMTPILIRRVLSEPSSFEIICGARRWFACSQIPGQKVLASVIEADDKTCMVLMHSENADSEDISEFERAYSMAQQMKSGLFKNQTELASAMGLSQSSISKMIQAAEIFELDWIASLFESKLALRVREAYVLSKHLKKEKDHQKIKAEAGLIAQTRAQNGGLGDSEILRRLLGRVGAIKPESVYRAVFVDDSGQALIGVQQQHTGLFCLSLHPKLKGRDQVAVETLCAQAIREYLRGVIPQE
jgi:ParB family chromosome partitioning protein